jgi:hypothetical protein
MERYRVGKKNLPIGGSGGEIVCDFENRLLLQGQLDLLANLELGRLDARIN